MILAALMAACPKYSPLHRATRERFYASDGGAGTGDRGETGSLRRREGET